MNEVVTVVDVSKWLITALSFLVSLLTLYNASRLKTGILAVATYAFGGGMLCLSAAFLTTALAAWSVSEFTEIIRVILLIVGFCLLGFGSYKVYSMSKIA